MDQTNQKRPLTAEEKSECARALDAWLVFKESEAFQGRKWTQDMLAASLGFSQGNLGHYLHGRQPLNVNIVSALARKFGIPPDQISPRLARVLYNDSVGPIESLLADLPVAGAQATIDFIEFQVHQHGRAMSPEKMAHYMAWAARIREDMKRRLRDADGDNQ